MGGKKVADWIFLSSEGLPPEEHLLSGFLQDDRQDEWTHSNPDTVGAHSVALKTCLVWVD